MTTVETKLPTAPDSIKSICPFDVKILLVKSAPPAARALNTKITALDKAVHAATHHATDRFNTVAKKYMTALATFGDAKADERRERLRVEYENAKKAIAVRYERFRPQFEALATERLTIKTK